MVEIKTKLRKWGNSLGIVVPQSVVKDGGIQEGDKVIAIVLKEGNVLRDMFGKVKFRKSTQKMMGEINAELYNE